MSETNSRHLRCFGKLLFVLALVAATLPPRVLAAQNFQKNGLSGDLTWTTDSTGPRRFISVHGKRAAIFGYSEDGLEVWAYPLQILSSYSVSFRQQGTTTGINGLSILRRIIYSPEAVTRIYAGPDFIVREKLFVPPDEPGAIIEYEVHSARPIEIVFRFTPVLDLMWPASIGGQEFAWNDKASAYLLFEATHRFSASIGSPNIIAHDETPNSTQDVKQTPGLAFTMRAGGASENIARVTIAGGPGQDATAVAKKILESQAPLEEAAHNHYSDLLNRELQIETPDADTNRALAWAEVALDQAWVCNPDLGCGIVAGYGPSRKARRPQYDWFFAGDGMVAVEALLAAGDYDRARDELEFVLKYQDQKSGMIWHELSQSAGLLDWGKYPYKFVHVDLTFDFLNTVGDYFSTTGDLNFVEAHWTAIQSAYQYCRVLLDPRDGLPRIPSDKEGNSEQDALGDELTLSANWVAASRAFANLATATNHKIEAEEATADSQKAGQTIAGRYWDEQQHFWIAGYTRSVKPLLNRSIGPVGILGTNMFSSAQQNSLLDQLASSNFQADWGTRGKGSNGDTYDPNSYSRGSVWATGTSSTADAFWATHRPATAFPIWSALVPWSSLDSLGHMHEALAGDYYHEEIESVPEQTWSSAMFLSSTVKGLLGIRIDASSNRLTFAPHLPPSWDGVTVRNLRVGRSEISIKMSQSAGEIRLEIQNEGAAVEVAFDPEIPLGATLRDARLEDRSIPVKLEQHAQDTHASVEFSLPSGKSEITISYTGGVSIISEPTKLMIGDSSKAIKITGINLERKTYTVGFDYIPPEPSSFEVRTPWELAKAQGGTAETISDGLYKIKVTSVAQQEKSKSYQHGKIVLSFASN
jgi:glycogen debranching enzyme